MGELQLAQKSDALKVQLVRSARLTLLTLQVTYSIWVNVKLVLVTCSKKCAEIAIEILWNGFWGSVQGKLYQSVTGCPSEPCIFLERSF